MLKKYHLNTRNTELNENEIYVCIHQTSTTLMCEIAILVRTSTTTLIYSWPVVGPTCHLCTSFVILVHNQAAILINFLTLGWCTSSQKRRILQAKMRYENKRDIYKDRTRHATNNIFSFDSHSTFLIKISHYPRYSSTPINLIMILLI